MKLTGKLTAKPWKKLKKEKRNLLHGKNTKQGGEKEYKLIIPKKVTKQIDKLPEKERKKIREKIKALKNNPRPNGSKKIKEYEKAYRIRQGDYRAVYEIHEDEVIIILIEVGKRSNIYKKI